MSSNGNTHWCHQCLEPVRLQGRNPVCPYCHGGFVQELNEDDFEPFHGHDVSDYSFMDRFPNPRNSIMDAFAELINQRMADRNPNFGFESLLHGGSSNSRHSNASNFFMGTGLEQLIEQLIANDGTQPQGPPPATQSAIDSLPTIRITNRHLNTDSHCPVCQDKFDLGSEAKTMPCNHIYHSGCIVPWLLEHNSCPVCRLELNNSNSNNSAGDGNGRSQGRRNAYLWPFWE